MHQQTWPTQPELTRQEVAAGLPTRPVPAEPDLATLRAKARLDADRFVGNPEAPARLLPYLPSDAFGTLDINTMPETLPYPNPVREATDITGRSPTTIEVHWLVPQAYDDPQAQTAYATAISYTLINSIFDQFENWPDNSRPLGGWLERFGNSTTWGFKLYFSPRRDGGAIAAAYRWWQAGQFTQAYGNIMVPLSASLFSEIKLGAYVYNMLIDGNTQIQWAMAQSQYGIFYSPYEEARRTRTTQIAIAERVLAERNAAATSTAFAAMATRQAGKGDRTFSQGKGNQGKGKGAGAPLTPSGGRRGPTASQPQPAADIVLDPRLRPTLQGQPSSTARDTSGARADTSIGTAPRPNSAQTDGGELESRSVRTVNRKKDRLLQDTGESSNMPNPACDPLGRSSQHTALDTCHKLSRVTLVKTSLHTFEESVVRLTCEPDCSQGIDHTDKSMLRIELRGGKNNCFLAAIVACGLGKVCPPSEMGSICRTLRQQLKLSKSDALTTVEQRRVLQYYAMNVLIILGNQITLCMAGPRGANRWAVLSLVHAHHVALVLREESLRPLVIHAKEVPKTLAALGVTHAGWSDLGHLGMESVPKEGHYARETEGEREADVTTPLSITEPVASAAPPLSRGTMHAPRVDLSSEGEGGMPPAVNPPAPPATAPAEATPPPAAMNPRRLRGAPGWQPPIEATPMSAIRPHDLTAILDLLSHAEPPRGEGGDPPPAYIPFTAPSTPEALVAALRAALTRETSGPGHAMHPIAEEPPDPEPARTSTTGWRCEGTETRVPPSDPSGEMPPSRCPATTGGAEPPILRGAEGATSTPAGTRDPLGDSERIHPTRHLTWADARSTPIPAADARPVSYECTTAGTTRVPTLIPPPSTAMHATTTYSALPTPGLDEVRHMVPPHERMRASGGLPTGSPYDAPMPLTVWEGEPTREYSNLLAHAGTVADTRWPPATVEAGRVGTPHMFSFPPVHHPSSGLPPAFPVPGAAFGAPGYPMHPTERTPSGVSSFATHPPGCTPIGAPGYSTSPPGCAPRTPLPPPVMTSMPSRPTWGMVHLLPVLVEAKVPGARQRVWQEDKWEPFLTTLAPAIAQFAQALSDTVLSISYDGAYGALTEQVAELVARAYMHRLQTVPPGTTFSRAVSYPRSWLRLIPPPVYIVYVAVPLEDGETPPSPLKGYDLERFVVTLKMCLQPVPVASDEESMVTPLIELLTPGARRAGVEILHAPRAPPPPQGHEANSADQVPKWDRSWVAQIGKGLPQWSTKLTNMAAWHLRVVLAFNSGQCRHMVPGLVTYAEGLRSLATALKSCIHSAPHAQTLATVYDSDLHVRSVDALCDEMQAWLLGSLRGGKKAESMRSDFMYCLHVLLLELRAIASAHDTNAMGRYEARRVAERTRRQGIDDAAWVKEYTEVFSCYTTLWGPHLSDLYIKGEMKDFLLQLVRNIQEETWKHQVMMLAEEFMKAYAKEQGRTLDSLRGATEENQLVEVPVWKVFTSPRTPTASTTVRFFQGPHQLRRIIELGLLQRFVSEMSVQLLGPTNYYTLTSEAGGKDSAQVMPVFAIDAPEGEQTEAATSSQGIQLITKAKQTRFAAEAAPAATSASTPPPAQVEKLRKEQEEWMKGFQASCEKYLEQQAEHNKSSLLNIHRQLDNLATRTELHRAPSSSLTAPIANADVRTPPMGERRQTPQGATSRRTDAQRGGDRYPPRRAEDGGSGGLRLMDKPPTPWDDIPEHVKKMLSSLGMRDKAAWEAATNTPCGLCGPYANHAWSRCLKIFASTRRGEEVLGKMNAARQLDRLMNPRQGQHLVADLEGPLAIALVQGGAGADADDQARAMLEEVCELFQVGLDDSVEVFEQAIPEAMWLGTQLKKAYDAGDSSA